MEDQQPPTDLQESQVGEPLLFVGRPTTTQYGTAYEIGSCGPLLGVPPLSAQQQSGQAEPLRKRLLSECTTDRRYRHGSSSVHPWCLAGGWCWRKLTPLLRAAGHEAYTPSLTGLGERSHLLTPEIDLDNYVQDLLGLFYFEDLEEVIVVGHSYGGMLIPIVVEQSSDRNDVTACLSASVKCMRVSSS